MMQQQEQQEQQNNKRSSPTTEDTSPPTKRPAFESHKEEDNTHVRYTFRVADLGMRIIGLPGADEHNRVKLTDDDDDDVPTAEQLADGYVDYRLTYSTKGKYAMVRFLQQQYDMNLGDYDGMSLIPHAVEKKLDLDNHNESLATVFCEKSESECAWHDVHSIRFLEDGESTWSPNDYKLELVVRKEQHVEAHSLAFILREYLQETEKYDEDGNDPYYPNFFAQYEFNFRSLSLFDTEPCTV